MGRRGPPKTPTAIQDLKGNPSHRPRNSNEPQPTAIADLSPPPQLVDELALAEWRRVAPELARLKLLTDLERNHLAVLCQAFAMSCRCQKTLETEGTTRVVETKNGTFPTAAPEFNQLMKLWQVMRSCHSDLGMTPSSRASLSPQETKQAKGAKLAEFLQRK